VGQLSKLFKSDVSLSRAMQPHYLKGWLNWWSSRKPRRSLHH